MVISETISTPEIGVSPLGSLYDVRNLSIGCHTTSSQQAQPLAMVVTNTMTILTGLSYPGPGM